MGCEGVGALVHNVEQDDRLDSAVVSLLVVAQERILMTLMPPEAVPQQPLTLALLQARRSTIHSCSVTAFQSLVKPVSSSVLNPAPSCCWLEVIMIDRSAPPSQ